MIFSVVSNILPSPSSPSASSMSSSPSPSSSSPNASSSSSSRSSSSSAPFSSAPFDSSSTCAAEPFFALFSFLASSTSSWERKEKQTFKLDDILKLFFWTNENYYADQRFDQFKVNFCLNDCSHWSSLRGQFLARNRSYTCCVDMPHNLLTKAWSDLFWTGLKRERGGINLQQK
jgi:hypothetical protein